MTHKLRLIKCERMYHTKTSFHDIVFNYDSIFVQNFISLFLKLFCQQKTCQECVTNFNKLYLAIISRVALCYWLDILFVFPRNNWEHWLLKSFGNVPCEPYNNIVPFNFYFIIVSSALNFDLCLFWSKE